MSTPILHPERDWSVVTLREMRAWIAKRASQAQVPLPCHWIYGADNGKNYCRPCCERRVAAIRRQRPKSASEDGVVVDGGWSTEHDSRPFCDTCGAALEGTLTDWGIDDELDHFETHPPTCPDDWAVIDLLMINIDGSDMTAAAFFAMAQSQGKLDRAIHEQAQRAWRIVAPYVLASMQSGEGR